MQCNRNTIATELNKKDHSVTFLLVFYFTNSYYVLSTVDCLTNISYYNL